MIVGEEIISRGLIKFPNSKRLKNGTYDLTIGEIFPIGPEEANLRGTSQGNISQYSLGPQQMVWVLSKEHFNMPSDVTGLATLRTRLTHQGLLALNVGIIDSHFVGQVSTVIVNFSNQVRTIEVGMPFFRIIFFDHKNVSAPEISDSASISSTVNAKAAGEFPRNFLNFPGESNEYHGYQLLKLMQGFSKTFPKLSVLISLIVVANIIQYSGILVEFAKIVTGYDIKEFFSRFFNPS